VKTFRTKFPQRAALLSSLVVFSLAGCGSDDSSPAPAAKTFQTLDGKQPIVIAHRGASGYFPEETLEAYTLAIAMGADVIEPDLMETKDGALVARHDVFLSASTDVADHPEFASRKRAGENGDGEAVAGDWFVSDFTLAELKTLRARSPNHATAQQFDNLFQIATLQEILDLRAAKSAQTGRTISVYPETKNPSYHLALWKAGQVPQRLEDALFALIKQYNLNAKDAPIYVQSFEPGSLQYMRSLGSQTKQVQLIDAYDVDFKAATMIYGTTPDHLVYSQPTDWKLAGDTRLFDWFLTPTGLAFVKTYADGIGPWKPMLVPVKCTVDANGNCTDLDGSGGFNGYPDANSQTPTTLVTDAHKAGLFVHEYTFRNEKDGYYNLTKDMNGDPQNEYLQHFRLGVDGVFTDQSDTAVAARTKYVKELGL
jgi:glycerophosphoryl diester phosphodiesterase